MPRQGRAPPGSGGGGLHHAACQKETRKLLMEPTLLSSVVSFVAIAVDVLAVIGGIGWLCAG